MFITPKETDNNRRDVIKALGFSSLSLALNVSSTHSLEKNISNRTITSIQSVKNYNNYYEFSTDKEAVKTLAQDFVVSPWLISVEGQVKNPFTIDLKSINQLALVDRTYSLRCVEGWSMLIPWRGIELNQLLKIAKLKPEARYVKFVGTYRPSQMYNQRRGVLPWPYTEGLRIDEAMHPLTLLATGMYNETLSKQNGAPLRLLVPWKYGFKSIKAISKIIIQKEKPLTSWNIKSPSEYGFYANVNPKVAHPRWSQSREIRIGELRKKATLAFNGYADEVAHLYNGMDLHQDF